MVEFPSSWWTIPPFLMSLEADMILAIMLGTKRTSESVKVNSIPSWLTRQSSTSPSDSASMIWPSPTTIWRVEGRRVLNLERSLQMWVVEAVSTSHLLEGGPKVMAKVSSITALLWPFSVWDFG